MSNLKQFLLIVLVLCTLGYSSAWAFDGHVMEQLESDLDSSTTDSNITVFDDSQNVAPDADIACDHCCHISSHLVAIFSDTNCAVTAGSAIYLLSLTERLNSFIPGPDLEPPRV